MTTRDFALTAILSGMLLLQAQNAPVRPLPAANPDTDSRPLSYVLGANDQLVFRALFAEEISEKPVRVDANGEVNLPMIGAVRVGGLTVREAEAEVRNRLSKYVRNPEVSAAVVEFRSQPVTVIGAVKNPGMHQLQGRKTLMEILSLAGGLADDAGYSVRITRKAQWGAIPLEGAALDSSGEFTTAEVKLRALLDGSRPKDNLAILPEDVISVPRGELVYVFGEVKKAGAFVLRDRESLSVLQAMSMAEGLLPNASPGRARVLRPTPGSNRRVEIPVDLKRIMQAKAEDIRLKPDDLLYIPSNTMRTVSLKALETAINLGTGVLIWRR